MGTVYEWVVEDMGTAAYDADTDIVDVNHYDRLAELPVWAHRPEMRIGLVKRNDHGRQYAYPLGPAMPAGFEDGDQDRVPKRFIDEWAKFYPLRSALDAAIASGRDDSDLQQLASEEEVANERPFGLVKIEERPAAAAARERILARGEAAGLSVKRLACNECGRTREDGIDFYSDGAELILCSNCVSEAGATPDPTQAVCDFCGGEDGRHVETCYVGDLEHRARIAYEERGHVEGLDEVFHNATVCEYAGHFEDASGRRGDWCECGWTFLVDAARLELVAATASLLRDIPSSAPHYVERLRAAWRSMAAASEAAELAGHELREFADVGDGTELASDLSVTEIYLARNSEAAFTAVPDDDSRIAR